METPEYYFRIGAEAMQSKIVAYLAMHGHIDIAPGILNLSVPEFKEPEIQTIDH